MTDLIRPKHLRPRAPVPKPHCAFCGRTEGQIPILITGKEARICNECVRVAAKQVDDIENAQKAPAVILQPTH